MYSVAVVLTLVQTKQVRINVHKTIQKHSTTIQNTVNTSIHVIKTPTHYKTHIHTHPHVTKQAKTTTLRVKTNTVQL